MNFRVDIRGRVSVYKRGQIITKYVNLRTWKPQFYLVNCPFGNFDKHHGLMEMVMFHTKINLIVMNGRSDFS